MEKISITIEGNSSEMDDIRMCLTVLFSTAVGTVALDRDFGLDWSFLDLPQNIAQANMEVEITKKVRKYEKRVKIKKILWTHGDGMMRPKVVFAIV